MSIEETYFSLLRSALWGDGCPPVRKEDVPVLSDIAIKQSTAPMIYDRLLACGAGISAEKTVRMKQFIAKNIMTHTSLNTLLAKVVKELRGMGIDGVLLKGQGNASHYRRPELRACGDIDYYVGEENFMEAAHYISRLAGEKEFNEKRVSPKHYDANIGQLEVEIHRRSQVLYPEKRDRIYRRYSADGLHKNLVPIEFAGVEVMTPEPTFNALFIFQHYWNHLTTSGIGMRHICDWTVHLDAFSDKIDRQRLETMIKELGLETPWKCCAYIAVEKLGLPEEKMPLYDKDYAKKGERLLRMIMKYGNFGRAHLPKLSRPANYLLGKAYSLSHHIRKFIDTTAISPKLAIYYLQDMLGNGFKAVFKDLRK